LLIAELPKFLPKDSELREQLIGPEFTLNSRDEIPLEPKDSMKRRGVASPDIADALACTFACEYATLPARDWEGRGDHLVRTDWDPFAPDVDGRWCDEEAGCGTAVLR
jgi:hypothetical protein